MILSIIWLNINRNTRIRNPPISVLNKFKALNLHLNTKIFNLYMYPFVNQNRLIHINDIQYIFLLFVKSGSKSFGV